MPDDFDLSDLDILNDDGDPDDSGGRDTSDSDVEDPNEDPETSESEDEEEESSEDSEEDEEEEEDEDEEREEKDEKEEKPEEQEGDDKKKKVKPVVEGKPTYQELKEADPDLFKKVPGLKDIFFREQKFSEMFASVDEARAAATKAENYDILESSLLNGDPSLLIKELGQNAPQSLVSLIDNFLPKLQGMSRQLYVRATKPVLEDLIRLAYEDGKRLGDKNLMNAAGHLAKHAFGSPSIPEPRNIRTEPHPAEVQLKEMRDRYFSERYSQFDREVGSEAYERIEKMASKINDPENKLTGYLKKSIIRDTISELDTVLSKDQQLTNTLKQLWKRATLGGFTREHKEAIINAHLSRAKQLLPGIRDRLVAEALNKPLDKGKGKKKKKVIPDSGRGAAGKRPNTNLDPRRIDWSRTSDLDILSDRVTLKGK